MLYSTVWYSTVWQQTRAVCLSDATFLPPPAAAMCLHELKCYSAAQGKSIKEKIAICSSLFFFFLTQLDGAEHNYPGVIFKK